MPSPIPNLPPIKPISFPELKPIGTDSVSKKTQSLKEWAMAGGGVPASHKGREHVWHRKANSYAAGGEVFNTTPDVADRGDIIQGPAYAGGGPIRLAKGGDPLDEFVPPRYRSAGRRPVGQDDRKAAANMPVDFARGAVAGALGAPGDIESLVRMIPGLERSQGLGDLVTGKPRETYLPTSGEIEQRLPFRSDTPQGRAAAGLGTLAGGFYTGPGAPIRLVGGVPKAVYKAAKDFSQAAGRPTANVIKMPGGNWLTGQVEKDLKPLKRYESPTSEEKALLKKQREDLMAKPESEQRTRSLRAVDADIAAQNRNEALNKWVDSNLSNYIKKQMATPDDPIRALAEQGITHLPKDVMQGGIDWLPESLGVARMEQGFPVHGMGQSNMAKGWENLSDVAIDISPASAYTKPLTPREIRAGYKSFTETNPWLNKVDPNAPIYNPIAMSNAGSGLGFEHIMDVLRQDLSAGLIRPEQLNKISITDAVRRTYQYDQDMAKKMAETQAKVTEGMPVHKEYPEGYKWIELAPRNVDELRGVHAEFVRKDFPNLEKTDPTKFADYVEDSMLSAKNIDQQKLADALKYEGETMGHCVGGYCPDVVAGRSRIYSLRDAKGEPHVTVETAPVGKGMLSGDDLNDMEPGLFKQYANQINFENGISDMHKWLQSARPDLANAERIVQIKGKQNRAPKEDYLPFVQDFVKSGNWFDVGDLRNTGLRDIKKTPKVEEYIKKKGVDAPRYLPENEYQGYESDFIMDELYPKNESPLQPPEPNMAGGGAPKKIIEGAVKGVKKLLGMADETPKGVDPIVVRTPEERAVIDKFGQKQDQEAARQKKVEKAAKESASKSPEAQAVKPTKSTGRRVAVPPDVYRKMAEDQGDEAVLKAARAGKHLKPTNEGYIGAPRTVTSGQGLGAMRRGMDTDFADSVEAVRLADPERLGTWYDRAKQGIAESVEPYQLPRTLEQHGVYSAGVSPESELTFSLKHLNSRVAGEPGMAYRGAGMRNLDEAVAEGRPANMGFKIGEYAEKNDPRVPNAGLFGVNDFRRAQGMGYTDPQGNPWKAGVSDTMHPFMDAETALQVDRANAAGTGGRTDWQGPHIQEVPWVYGKGQDLHGRGLKGRYAGDELEGIKMSLRDANNTARDYFYKHAGSSTHEAIPGANTGHVPQMIDAPYEQKVAYGNTGRWDVPAPEYALSDMGTVGAGNRDAIYSALGYRQLPTIEASGAYFPEGSNIAEHQPVKIARPLLDFPTGGGGIVSEPTRQTMEFAERFRALGDAQEAFGFNLPNTMADVKGKNSLVLDTRGANPRYLDEPHTGVMPDEKQMGALTQALSETGYGIAPTSRGATVFPFDSKATAADARRLMKDKGSALQQIYPSKMEPSLNTSGYGPGVGMYTPDGFKATEPFSGQATMGLLKEASYLPPEVAINLGESEDVRKALKGKIKRDAALPNARADIQETRRFFSEADWPKAVALIRQGYTPAAALAALGYSASSMAEERR